MSGKEEGVEWSLKAATYTKVREHADITVYTEDGQSWHAILRRYTKGAQKAFLVLEARGLRDKGLAISVSEDLYKLAKTVAPNDCSADSDTLIRRKID